MEKTLAENYMNKIKKLFDENFVRELFTQEILPHYPAFSAVSRVEIRPYKNLVWETTYHVVIGFTTYFLKSTGEEIKIPIFCSAHSEEPRENIYRALQYLRAVGFPTDFIDIPDPLFYSEYFRGTFYRGLKGENLLYYIKKKDFATVTKIVAATAKLFARLHVMPVEPRANFNPVNSRIKTVIPGVQRTLQEMSARYDGRYQDDLRNIYNYLIRQEEKYFAAGGQAALIHGDAHPENILVTSPERLGLIDFADMCLGDPARDLGSFLQQLEYKITVKADEPVVADNLKKLFLDTYSIATGQKLNSDLRERIDLYYHWTAVRTAVYLFLKFGHDEKRAASLLEKVKSNLGL